MSLQAFGEQVLMPFSHTGSGGGNQALLTSLANRFAAAVRNQNPQRNYQVGVGGVLRSPQSGTVTDYALGFLGIDYVYTIMLPRGGVSGFDPPTSAIKEIGGETFYGLLEFANFLIGAKK